jgi:hypothetical protein
MHARIKQTYYYKELCYLLRALLLINQWQVSFEYTKNICINIIIIIIIIQLN